MSVATMELEQVMAIMAEVLEGAPEEATAKGRMRYCSHKAVEFEGVPGREVHMEAAAAMALVFGAVYLVEIARSVALRVEVVE